MTLDVEDASRKSKANQADLYTFHEPQRSCDSLYVKPICCTLRSGLGTKEWVLLALFRDYFRGLPRLTKGQPGKSIKCDADYALSRWLLLL